MKKSSPIYQTANNFSKSCSKSENNLIFKKSKRNQGEWEGDDGEELEKVEEKLR